MEKNNINRIEAKKGRFNAADVLVIIVAILLLLAVVLVLDPFGWMSVADIDNVKMVYIVEISSVENDVASNIAIGDIAMLGSTSYEMGKVVDIKSTESYVWEPNEDGTEMVKKPVVGKSNIFISIESTVTYKNDVGYFLHGDRMTVGKHLDLRFQNFAGSGYIVSVEFAQ